MCAKAQSGDVVPSDPQEAEDAAKFFGSPEFRALSNKVTDKFASAHTPKPTAQGQQADTLDGFIKAHKALEDFTPPTSAKLVSDLVVERHEASTERANPTIDKIFSDLLTEFGHPPEYMMRPGQEQALSEAKAHLRTTILSAIPERGNDLHICRPVAHTKDPWKEGYKGYSDMEKEHPEYANCVFCGAKPSQMRYETMTSEMIGWNACRNTITKLLGEN